MNIEIRCPHPGCGAAFGADGRLHGRQVACPSCGRLVTVAPAEAFEHRAEDAPVRRTIPACGLLENIRSLHNVGSIFRTAEAAGFTRLLLAGVTGSPPRREISKTALGAEKVLPCERVPSAAEAAASLRASGVQVVALECGARARDYREDLWRPPVCIIVGNEVAGVSPEALEAADEVASLPMMGAKSSLNVAVAFGVAAYHLLAVLREDPPSG